MIVSDTISFEQAINLTQSLLEEIEIGKTTNQQLEETLTSLVKTMNGARGFFVTYLTSDYKFADEPSQTIINALKTAPEIVAELMLKNLVMSTAMAITHQRNCNSEMAKSSQKVTQRSLNLIKKLNLNLLNQELEIMAQNLTENTGKYQEFLTKWNYDQEQKQAMYEAIIEAQK